MILSVIIYIRNWKSHWQLCQRLFRKYKHKDWLSEVVVHYFVAVDIQWVALVGGRNCTQKAFRSYTCRPFCWRQRNGATGLRATSYPTWYWARWLLQPLQRGTLQMSLLRRSYSYLFKILKPIKKSPIVRARPKSRNQITSVQLVVPNPSRGARFPKTVTVKVALHRS